MFWAVKSAVGGSGRDSSAVTAPSEPAGVPDVLHDQGGVDGDAPGGERVAVAREPLDRGRDRAPVAEVGDAPVARGREVPHPLRGADLVGGEHRVDRQVARRPVDAHDRRAPPQFAREVGLVVPCGREHQPVDVPGAELLAQRLLAGGVLVEAGGEHEHPARHGDVLDRALDGGRERVGHVFEQQSDRGRPVIGTAQDPSAGVRTKVEVLDGLPHPSLQQRGDAALFVDDPGDGLEADLRPRCDVTHRGTTTVLC